MKPNRCLLATVAAAFLAAATYADASPAAQQKIGSAQYLVGTWNCAHTVGTFSGTYTTTYSRALGDLWLRQTYDFPPKQTAESEPAVHAEFIMGMTRGDRPGCALASSARANTSPSG
jgi:hypothetical protein